MSEIQKVIDEIRAKVPQGDVTGSILVDGEYVTISEETIYGNYRINFDLATDNTLEFDSRITFHNEDGGFDVSESAEEILNAGFNWWIENAEQVSRNHAM
ncbi:hypothetical protein P4H70_22970 [Paenibacillus ehimensis]|uniref:hypothetical protein n=1 Tax=Paenibacillus ehimensis TaxID=79264 RepID=UPI002DBBA0BC|nr:hypothetical protein [Paenibacillus ehimensis]MEC0211808.1 hypothetical protein [Paenibacillus ehimensis]